eukprot:4512411-Pyramimonas_sp.AAC.1
MASLCLLANAAVNLLVSCARTTARPRSSRPRPLARNFSQAGAPRQRAPGAGSTPRRCQIARLLWL